MIVAASLNRSLLWPHFQLFNLTTNIRAGGATDWSEFLLKVGEGRIPSDVPIPTQTRLAATIPELIQDVYGTFDEAVAQMSRKTILTPLNEDVSKVNDMVLERFPWRFEGVLNSTSSDSRLSLDDHVHHCQSREILWGNSSYPTNLIVPITVEPTVQLQAPPIACSPCICHDHK